MRIIILLSSFELGGAEKHGIKLANFFRNIRQYETEVWVMSEGTGDKGVKELCEKYDIPTKVVGEVSRISRFLYYRQIQQFAPLFKSFKPDVIISFNVLPNLINGLIYKHVGAKLSIWSQQSVNQYLPKSYIERKIIKNISLFISNSFHGAEKLKKDFDPPDHKIFIVPNGIELPKPLLTKDQWLEKLGLNQHHFKAVMVANLTQTKDHITLLKAWKIVSEKLNERGQNGKLILVGRLGNTANNILQFIQENDLLAHVIITGPINDIDGINQAMDLGILCSNAEGLPNSIMENMISGLPVVATDIEGIREVVGENNYQFLANRFDYKDLAEKILLFAANKGLRLKIGEDNKKRIEIEFSIEKMNQATEKIILDHLEDLSK
jgi:glycosyltransferase involved in cell wall biosynthesis